MDELSDNLNNSRIGCNLCGLLINHMLYADDIILISPSLAVLQMLVDICAHYASRYNIVFNVTKSECIAFPCEKSELDNLSAIVLNNCELKWKSSVRHLGHVLNTDLKDDSDIRSKCIDFIIKANHIISVFKFASKPIMVKLLKVHCTSFYGAVTWNLNNINISDCNVKYKNAIRRIFSLPRHSRSAIVLKLGDSLSVEAMVHRRFIKFFINECLSDNKILNHMSKFCTYNSRTITGMNLIFLHRTYKLSLFNLSKLDVSKMQNIISDDFLSENAPNENQFNTLIELLDVRENNINVENFTNEEIDELIYEVSTMR